MEWESNPNSSNKHHLNTVKWTPCVAMLKWQRKALGTVLYICKFDGWRKIIADGGAEIAVCRAMDIHIGQTQWEQWPHESKHNTAQSNAPLPLRCAQSHYIHRGKSVKLSIEFKFWIVSRYVLALCNRTNKTRKPMAVWVHFDFYSTNGYY